MDLPPFPLITEEALQAIAQRTGNGAMKITLLPQTGIFNQIYALGDSLILRVPRKHPDFIAALYTEALVVPLARTAGVHTPELVLFDDTLDVLPVPYTIYARVPGLHLESLGLEPAEAQEVWRAVGRDLARLHMGVLPAGKVGEIPPETNDDPRTRPEVLAQQGYFTTVEARWLMRWLEQLAPLATAPVPKRLLHNDVQTTNIMVQPDPLGYAALIDWGAAGWGDDATDIVGMPLSAAPYILAGHRAIAPFANDETAEARVIWAHLKIALKFLRRPPQPNLAWGERPLGMFFQVLRFLAETDDPHWRAFRWDATGAVPIR